jgi:hypothetical protein
LTHLKIAGTNQGAYKFTEENNKQKELLERLQMSHLGNEAALKDLSARIA